MTRERAREVDLIIRRFAREERLAAIKSIALDWVWIGGFLAICLLTAFLR